MTKENIDIKHKSRQYWVLKLTSASTLGPNLMGAAVAIAPALIRSLYRALAKGLNWRVESQRIESRNFPKRWKLTNALKCAAFPKIGGVATRWLKLTGCMPPVASTLARTLKVQVQFTHLLRSIPSPIHSDQPVLKTKDIKVKKNKRFYSQNKSFYSQNKSFYSQNKSFYSKITLSFYLPFSLDF